MCIVYYVCFALKEVLWDLDAYTVQFFYKRSHTLLINAVNVFPLKWAPWHHFCLRKVMKTWTEPFQSSRKLWTVLSFVFFWKDKNVMSSFPVFFFQTVAVVVLKMSWSEWEGLFEKMKWLGQVCCNICAKGTPSSLLCLWNQSQAVHYLLSPTHCSKAYLLSFSF